MPPKPVILIFDDGCRGQVDNAMPAMKRQDWPGVLYMTTANFKSPPSRSSSSAYRVSSSMSARELVRELEQLGWR